MLILQSTSSVGSPQGPVSSDGPTQGRPAVSLRAHTHLTRIPETPRGIKTKHVVSIQELPQGNQPLRGANMCGRISRSPKSAASIYGDLQDVAEPRLLALVSWRKSHRSHELLPTPSTTNFDQVRQMLSNQWQSWFSLRRC